MNVTKIEVDRSKARELYRAYKKHQHYSDPIDEEIQRAYQLIAQGRMVIQAFESIRAAGQDEKGLPKLALCRADAKMCYWRPAHQRGTFMADTQWTRSNMSRSKALMFDWRGLASSRDGESRVPPVPLHLRPHRGLANYHILWEAEWTPIPPQDPYLLRRIGRGDMWLVVAAWDLTPVERAALSTRLSG